MLRIVFAVVAVATGAEAQTLPLNSSCRTPTFANDAYQAFGDLLVFGKRAEKHGEKVPEEWQRPDGFFSAKYLGTTSCEQVGNVTFEIGIDLRSGAAYSNHPHIQIFDQKNKKLLQRWVWPDYSCNAFSYDMTRSLRTYNGPLQFGMLEVTVVDLARRLSVEVAGCQTFEMKRQPWPY
ncbi:MAG: hypothetical protein AAFN16_24360 [Pseudomonadota bacterium]